MIDNLNMKINELMVDTILTLEYFLKYGYFSFKRGKIKIDSDSSGVEDEYQTTVSDMFSNRIWTMEEIHSFLEENVQITEKIFENLDKPGYRTGPIEIHGFKANYTKRKFKFINFYNYIGLSLFLIKERKEYENLFLNDENSTSKFFHTSYIGNSIRASKDIRCKNNNLILKTDLSQFYPSLYTHTIPWVFMGKQEAKKERKEGFSNNLDKLIQKSQSGETKGIPTGSFLSRFIAEIYQMKIDEKIISQIQEKKLNIHFHRYVDDYKFYYNQTSHRESILNIIYDVYSDYELQINDAKLKEISYPDQNKDTVELQLFFEKLYGTIRRILEEKVSDNEKANAIVKYVYQYIEMYQCLKKEADIKMPIYFPIKKFLLMLKTDSLGVYQEILRKNMLFEFVNVFLLDMKYLQYFMQFIDEIYADSPPEIVRNTFNTYEMIFNEKIEYYYNYGLQVELSYFLTLKLLYPYFKINEDMLKKIIENNDSVTALLAFKILYKSNCKLAVDTAISRVVKFSDSTTQSGKHDAILSFKNENFLFEYEIARLYLHEIVFGTEMVTEDRIKFVNRLNQLSKTDSDLESFYHALLKANIKFVLL